MIDSRTAPYAALVMRLALGIMFLAHGLTKVFVFTPAGTVGFFQSIGFPGFLAYPVMAFEVIGGLMLVLGVYTRSVAALAVIQLFRQRLELHQPQWRLGISDLSGRHRAGCSPAGRRCLRREAVKNVNMQNGALDQ
jgi:hypothetical protein